MGDRGDGGGGGHVSDEGKVYVGGVEGVEERDLTDAFERFGNIAKVWIARNPPGFAFIVRR